MSDRRNIGSTNRGENEFDGIGCTGGTEDSPAAALEVDVDDDSSSSSSEGKGDSWDEISVIEELNVAASDKPALVEAQSMQIAASIENDQLVILLPSGLVIHDRILLSLSVHHTIVRGTYASKVGYTEFEAKGFIGEVIWPKVMKVRHSLFDPLHFWLHQCVQSKLSILQYCRIKGATYRYLCHLWTLLVGGLQLDKCGPVEQPTKLLAEVNRDVTFPLYED